MLSMSCKLYCCHSCCHLHVICLSACCWRHWLTVHPSSGTVPEHDRPVTLHCLCPAWSSTHMRNSCLATYANQPLSFSFFLLQLLYNIITITIISLLSLVGHCRVRHADVLEFIWLLNSHPEVTYTWMHGDKDTYRLGFHLANKSADFAQVGLAGVLYVSAQQ